MEKSRVIHSITSQLLVCCLLATGCATTSGGGGGPAPIPEGMGRLILDAGGINELNFYVIDQDTDEEVYSDTPRLSASSPAYYEMGAQEFRLMCDISPGLYTVVVNTDIDDNVEIRDVEIGLGEEKYVRVNVGRFSVRFTGGEDLGRQDPLPNHGLQHANCSGQGNDLLRDSLFHSPSRKVLQGAYRKFTERTRRVPAGRGNLRRELLT